MDIRRAREKAWKIIRFGMALGLAFRLGQCSNEMIHDIDKERYIQQSSRSCKQRYSRIGSFKNPSEHYINTRYLADKYGLNISEDALSENEYHIENHPRAEQDSLYINNQCYRRS